MRDSRLKGQPMARSRYSRIVSLCHPEWKLKKYQGTVFLKSGAILRAEEADNDLRPKNSNGGLNSVQRPKLGSRVYGQRRRNRAFSLESAARHEQHERLDALCEGPRRPFILELEERLSAVLRTAVSFRCIPIILSRLEKWAYSMARLWKSKCSGSTPNAV